MLQTEAFSTKSVTESKFVFHVQGLIPCLRTVVSNLDNVGKNSEAVELHKEVKHYRGSVVNAIKCLLCCGDRIIEGLQRRLGNRLGQQFNDRNAHVDIPCCRC